MISHPAYTVEPWALRETELDLGVLDQAGSVFALANGHIGLRGNLDESEPQGLPGSYLNGFYEERALPYAEAGYGYPEAGQTAVNVTNGKIIRLLVDDEPFDVRSGTLRSHERVLDLRAGVLRRRVDWVSPAGQQVRVSSVRLVSLVQRAVAAVLYEVEPHRRPRPARGPVRARGQRADAGRSGRSPRRAAVGRRAALRAVLRSRRPGRAGAHHPQERAADRGRHGSPRRRPAGDRDGDGEQRGPRAPDDHGRRQAGRAVADGQVPRLRMVEPTLDAGAARSGRRGAGRGAARRLGGTARRPARIPGRLLGARRRRAGR